MHKRIAFVLSLVTAAGASRGAAQKKSYTPADVHFVAGMIGHHAQAIQMAGWAPSHGASPSVRVLCERIVVAQNDEIAFAQRWLREHGDRKSTRLNSSHSQISYAALCLTNDK